MTRTILLLIGSVILTARAIGAPQCNAGFVPRRASPADEVCVPFAKRQQTVAENARAPLLWRQGNFGPKTCVVGYVWREAFQGDLVCVTPSVRAETLEDNAKAPLRRRSP